MTHTLRHKRDSRALKKKLIKNKSVLGIKLFFEKYLASKFANRGSQILRCLLFFGGVAEATDVETVQQQIRAYDAKILLPVTHTVETLRI